MPNLINDIFTEQNFSAISRKPCYFGETNKPLLGWLHTSQVSKPLDTCLVLCPPLGVEYMNSYRSLRYVADYFALAGIPVMRFDYHGTGDSSGSNVDENRLPDWIGSIEQCCNFAKQITKCSKVGLFGFRIGATFAALTADKIDVDFMVLWAALEKGKRFIRETRVTQLTGSTQLTSKEAERLEAGGMVFWPETEQAIKQIDLFKLLPKSSRILIIPKDGFVPDEKLKDKWLSSGLKTEQLELEGSTEMLLDAHISKIPHQSIEKIVDWVTSSSISTRSNFDHKKLIDDGLINSNFQNRCRITVPDPTEIDTHEKDVEIEETFFHFGPNKSRFGICTTPISGINQALPKIILTNSGSNHRVGPSRLYVSLARKLCSYGFQVFRIDIQGLGDSYVHDRNNENKEYLQAASQEMSIVINAINELYPKSQYLMAGLCSGAYFSFHAALDLKNARIVESILINPLTFYWEKDFDYHSSPSKNTQNWSWYHKALIRPESWKKLFAGNVDYRFLLQTIYSRVKINLSNRTKNIRKKLNLEKHSQGGNELDVDLVKIVQNKTKVTLLLSKSDPGYDLLMTGAGSTAKKLIKGGQIEIFFIERADHTFSLLSARVKAVDTMVNHIVNSYC